MSNESTKEPVTSITIEEMRSKHPTHDGRIARSSELIRLSWSRPLTAEERAEKLELEILLGY